MEKQKVPGSGNRGNRRDEPHTQPKGSDLASRSHNLPNLVRGVARGDGGRMNRINRIKRPTSCRTCGQAITQKPGLKPREFCDNRGVCREVWHRIEHVATLLDDPRFNPTKEKMRLIRAQLWAMANLLNTKPEAQSASVECVDSAISKEVSLQEQVCEEALMV